MDKILRFFRPLLALNYKHPFWVLTVAVLSAVVASFFALQLKVDTDLAHLLPQDNEYVLALEELQKSVGGETSMGVVIKSPSFADNKRFAKDLIEKSLQLYHEPTGKPFFERAIFRKETDMLENNALYFATPSELQNITEYLQEEIDEAKRKANPFYIDLGGGEEEADSTDQQLDKIEENFEALIPSEYPISADSTVMLLKFPITGSKSNLAYLEDMFAAYDSLLTAMNPQSYNANMQVEFGGRLQRHLMQFESIMNDVFNSFGSGIGSVVLLVMLYFFIKKYVHYRRGSPEDRTRSFWEHAMRMPVPIIVIGVPLIISLAWTFGITYWALGTLNTMTSVLFVILFGLGIDYGIHFYGRYIETRSEGQSIERTIIRTYHNTGSALMTSAMTTAFSLFVLIFARFRGFSEFGFIAGLGIIMALLCMLFVLPAVLVIIEKGDGILLNVTVKEQQKKRLFNRFPLARTFVVLGLVVSVAVVANYKFLDFQYDFGELEPEIPAYNVFNHLSSRVESGDRRNPAYILADNRQDVIKIMEELRHHMKTDTVSPTILSVEALPERFPATDSAAKQKLQKIAHIRELLQDPFIKEQEGRQLDRLRRATQTTAPIGIEEIPDYYKNQFLNKEGEVGNFVIVYPSVGLSNGRKSIAFKDDVGKIVLDNGKTYYAASTSIIAAEMLDLLSSEAPWMVCATLLMVFLFMWASFRSLKWTFIALLPLVVGLLWMFGIMILTGMMFNLYNLVVLPAILGIGDDSGVHIAHRYIEEGSGSIGEVLYSTGQHVLIASITTMLGFAGLLFANHPGLQSLGVMGVLGIGTTLLAAFTFMPALIQWMEDRGQI